MSGPVCDVMHVEGGRPVKMWTRGVPVEEGARKQLANMARMPCVRGHVAVMPDVHVGIGATVDSVVATQGAIIPAAVGVDLGCGMIALATTLRAEQLPDSLAALRRSIELAVPHGIVTDRDYARRGSWRETPAPVIGRWAALAERFARIVAKRPVLQNRPEAQLGTLGGGNHFIELCLDTEGVVWVMLHSGSRGVGNRIGQLFIELARKDMRRHFINLPDRDLAYLVEGTDHFDDYVEAMSWAQDYAAENRKAMMHSVLEVPRAALLPFELGIIPGSMGARSFIVRGLGNAESFESCSHGAGRRMSRTEARRRFSVEDHMAATGGVECRKDAGVIDETPAAYKDIDAVMAAQRDLVEVVATLKQVLCVKG